MPGGVLERRYEVDSNNVGKFVSNVPILDNPLRTSVGTIEVEIQEAANTSADASSLRISCSVQ